MSSNKVNKPSFLFIDLPNELLTEITNYFGSTWSPVVFNVLLSCQTLYNFLYSDPKNVLYGPCCKHVRYVLSTLEYHRTISKCTHFVHILRVRVSSDEHTTHLRDINDLTIYCNKVSDNGIEMLTNVCVLDISRNSKVTGVGFRELSNLRVVNLRGCCNLEDENLKFLANVRELNIASCTKISDEGIKYLHGVEKLVLFGIRGITGSNFGHLKNITDLNLHKCRKVTDESLKFLGKKVRSLEMGYCTIFDGSGFVNLTNISKLVLVRCSSVCDDSFKYLKSLHTLKIDSCYKVSDKALLYLENLHDLTLHYNYNIDGSGMANIKNLHTLDLKNIGIVDESMKHLENVHSLCLQYCHSFTDKGLLYLRGVKVLRIYDNIKITDSGFVNLKDSVLQVEIIKCPSVSQKCLQMFKKECQVKQVCVIQ